MNRALFRTRGIAVVIVLAICQVLSLSCSTRLYPASSFVNIESQKEKQELEEFLSSGTGKVLNTQNTSADEIIEAAKNYLGVPHCMGGTTRKCMDCSGLVMTVFATHNIQLPHNSEEQARYGSIISVMEDLKKGDLVFFIRSYKTNKFITHSGIYIGNNEFIHTSSSKGVTITSLHDPWWENKFIFGTRVFK